MSRRAVFPRMTSSNCRPRTVNVPLQVYPTVVMPVPEAMPAHPVTLTDTGMP
jgi:hypothetical protein